MAGVTGDPLDVGVLVEAGPGAVVVAEVTISGGAVTGFSFLDSSGGAAPLGGANGRTSGPDLVGVRVRPDFDDPAVEGRVLLRFDEVPSVLSSDPAAAPELLRFSDQVRGELVDVSSCSIDTSTAEVICDVAPPPAGAPPTRSVFDVRAVVVPAGFVVDGSGTAGPRGYGPALYPGV